MYLPGESSVADMAESVRHGSLGDMGIAVYIPVSNVHSMKPHPGWPPPGPYLLYDFQDVKSSNVGEILPFASSTMHSLLTCVNVALTADISASLRTLLKEGMAIEPSIARTAIATMSSNKENQSDSNLVNLVIFNAARLRRGCLPLSL